MFYMRTCQTRAWLIFLLDVIVKHLVSHGLVSVSFSWILLEAEIYVLVAFHLTSLCYSCLALDVCLFFLAFVIIRNEPLNLV